MIGINRKDIRAVLFYFHRIALVKEQFVILVRKSDEYIFPRICGKNVVKLNITGTFTPPVRNEETIVPD